MMMKKEEKTKKESLLEIEDLRIRLEEAEETLAMIRRGEVDGLVVSGPEGDQVFTLKGAESPYRFFVEAMNEGAVTLSSDGTILYCNDRFAEMVETPYQKIIGDSIYRFISSPDAFETAFQRGKREE
jgi:formate hydrogenlyase transcriptional activator